MEEWIKEAHKRLKTLSNVMPESDIRVVMAFIGPLTTETDGGAEVACSGGLDGPMPTIEEAGIIAVDLSEHLPASEQAYFIAGFQECVKYLMQNKRQAD